MKKITKYLIISLFLFAFVLFSNTNIRALSSGGAVDSGNNSGDAFIPGTSEEELELYEQCSNYITTNIISSESLTEALNGKIYATFTQEDCMEMINIASKREVIKNLINLEDVPSTNFGGITYSINNGIININGTTTHNFVLKFNLVSSLSLNGNYSSSLFEEGTKNNSWGIVLEFDDSSRSQDFGFVNSYINNSTSCLYMGFDTGFTYNNYVIKPMLEKGSTATRYVSYDYHREYYEEGITDADNRVNKDSISYTQGVTDADNRVNTDSVNYKTGVSSGYEKATKDGKSLGTFIPNLLGGFGSFFLTILNIDILGFNLLTVFGIIVAVAGVIIILKIVRG